jgi:hypothetical protein
MEEATLNQSRTEAGDDFSLPGIKTSRMFGVALSMIGLQSLTTGIAFRVIGDMGTDRFDQLTGRLVRTVSAQDQGLYEKAELLLVASPVFTVLGGLGLVLSVLVLLRPHIMRHKLIGLVVLKED